MKIFKLLDRLWNSCLFCAVFAAVFFGLYFIDLMPIVSVWQAISDAALTMILGARACWLLASAQGYEI